MAESVETVKIARDDHPNGAVIINKSDFDPKKHTLADAPKPNRVARKKRAK